MGIDIKMNAIHNGLIRYDVFNSRDSGILETTRCFFLVHM